MNPVPYALNQVILYGAVVDVQQEMSEQGVIVTLLVQTERTAEAHPVELRDRRALELLAYHQAQHDMYPNESFLVTVMGHLRTHHGYSLVEGETVTFHIPADVRLWGGQAVRGVFKRYAQLYGDRPWLAIESSMREALGVGETSEDSSVLATNSRRRTPVKEAK